MLEEKIEYVADTHPGIDARKPNPFIDSPAEYLANHICIELKKISQWNKLFKSFIDPYPRDDYAVRNLPALRIYDNGFFKEAESWFITGEIIADIIFPASIRRVEHQVIPNVVGTALMQQFRSPNLFNSLCDLVPGLNELGKTFRLEKDLVYVREEGSDMMPLTRIRLNFRIDLREWDSYLESTGRTKEEPFDVTLENLTVIAGIIEGISETNDSATIGTEQNVGD